MHGISGADGSALWNIGAWYNDTVSGQNVTAGIRTVPAVDTTYLTTGNTVGYAAFGNRVVAFDIFSGVLYADTNSSYVPNQGASNVDNFVSSPTLTTALDAVFIHSGSGTLWRVNISGNATALPVSLTFAWACDYFINSVSPLCDDVTPPALAAGAGAGAPRRVSLPVYDPVTGIVAGTRSVARSDIVPGGFYQPTTRTDREQLYDALRRLYAAAIGAESAADPRVVAASPSAMIRALPYEAVASIVTPSGYCLLDHDGVPAAARLRKASGSSVATGSGLPADATPVTLDAAKAAKTSAAALARPAAGSVPGGFGFGGIIPFATPSLASADAFLVISQYAAMGLDSASFGVDPSTGRQLWAMQNVSFPDGSMLVYGSSRSSPAIDASGNIYLGADSDHAAYRLPVVMALFPNGTYNWAAEMGNDNVVIGAASPAVAMGYQGEKRLYFVSGDGITAIDEGYACPGQLNAFTSCSGHGICNCTTGACLCSDRCRTGPDCGTQNTCR